MNRELKERFLMSMLRNKMDTSFFVPVYFTQEEYDEIVEKFKKEEEEKERKRLEEIEFMKQFLPK
ncbi:hypothetical protein FH114_02485 [Staphylococcus hominis]|uniref:hypothetical protein n=1 Tax=Staphylococcus hominis TaxID=1290 RepID=UPI001F58F20F|nr:hypothetical protein [Staphylococcus hominis]MCI2885902.1 hypothetical protein [Staphylococcus hominis]